MADSAASWMSPNNKQKKAGEQGKWMCLFVCLRNFSGAGIWSGGGVHQMEGSGRWIPSGVAPA